MPDTTRNDNYFDEYDRYNNERVYEDSECEYEDMNCEDNDIYDPEEPSPTRFNIVLCELHNEMLHGLENNSAVQYHYLVSSRFKSFNTECINDCAAIWKDQYRRLANSRIEKGRTHKIYRNYASIISKTNYIKPELAECLYLETQECVAVLKTIWIKLIQRKWRNIVHARREVMRKRSRPDAQHFMEINGRWPDDCLNYPSLKGMLLSIKN
jgi:hypothetical protein